MIFYQVKLNGKVMFLVEQEFADCYNDCELISIINIDKEFNRCVKLCFFTHLLIRYKNHILYLNLYHKDLTVDEIIDKTNKLKIDNITFTSNFILHNFFNLGKPKDITFSFRLDNLRKLMYDFIYLDKQQKYISLYELSKIKDLSYKDIYNLLSDNEKSLLKKRITEHIGE
jgi:hypothetical protein